MNKSSLSLTFVCLVCISLLNSTYAFSQAVKGDQEILVNGSFYGKTGDTGFFSLTGVFNYGVFVTDTLQVGGGPSITYTYYNYSNDYYFGDSSDSDLTVNLNFFIRQHFLKQGSKTVFYAGGEIYIFDAFASKEDSGMSFSEKLYLKPLIGLKYYFAQKAAFDINVGYGFGLKKGTGGVITGTFGVSIIL
jgi:hypothetical protein